MLEKNSKGKAKTLSAFLPKNLLSDLEDIPYSLQEKVNIYYSPLYLQLLFMHLILLLYLMV